MTAGGSFLHAEPHFTFLESAFKLLSGRVRYVNGKWVRFRLSYSTVDSYFTEAKLEWRKRQVTLPAYRGDFQPLSYPI